MIGLSRVRHRRAPSSAPALAERAYSAAGIAFGTLRYGRGRWLPPTQIGLGHSDQAA
jgi:hypothetical protein